MRPAVLIVLLSALVLFVASCDKKTTEVVTATVESPYFSPPAGLYGEGQYIFLACNTVGASIHYTTDGNEPTTGSPKYVDPLRIPDVFPIDEELVILKAKAFKTGSNPSMTVSATYTQTDETIVATPVISPYPGNLAVGASVFIECLTEGAEIRYTTNGSDPTNTSALYTVPVLLTETGNIIIKTRAYKIGLTDSPVAMASYTVGAVSPNMVRVEGGTFNNGFADVTISSYYIDKYETTQGSYAAVMGTNPATGFGEGADFPVYNVSWHQAIEYCNRRSIMEGYTPSYSYIVNTVPQINPLLWPDGWGDYLDSLSCDWNANGYRLPTEMEWLYAAKGGSLTQNYNYSGSNDINAVAWWGYYFEGNSGYGSSQVGKKSPNELGLYDMSGNLWEWCWDYFGLLPTDPETNPTGPVLGERKVRKGGSWAGLADNCLLATRFDTDEANSLIFIGLRVCRKAN